ncbi:heme lyase CcmF/NrfE family subunit [Enterovibrio makurazakiensis]|uniref:heme lyase CcmF/NrfE family subunit n=1 Tax=Enterovibrio makurazakiensis TaxID=2910232 RepID=UPI003D236D68
MLSEIGHCLLIVGITSAFSSSVLGGLSLCFPNTTFKETASMTPWLATLAFFCLFTATAILAFSFINDDFSLQYVAQHSNSALPTPFKLAAVWGGHEGSFLFMVLALSGWSALVANNKTLPEDYANAARFVLSTIVTLLGIYCLWLSNPFLRELPAALEGRDLNPMLQDIGLILHPPLLYLGYIGFAVPFAFAIAALLTQTPARAWADSCLRWALVTWAFLTVGIAIGSWWAYHELGWGGWWFWDPVENASLLPWLTATALIHCLVSTARNNTLVSWTLLLAIVTFALTILGTFIVRSGVLTSVHAFASAPMRGTGLLIILTVLLFPALLLFALRAANISHQDAEKSRWHPQRFWLMVAASLLCAMMLIVMLGTLYPMIYAAMGLGTLSVGAPYFNSLFVPLAVVSAFAATFSTARGLSKHKMRIGITVSLLVGCVITYLGTQYYQAPFSLMVSAALTASFSLIIATVYHWFNSSRTMAPIAMTLGHLSLAITIMGAALLDGFGSEISAKMQGNQHVYLGPYTVTHQGSSWHIGPNYTAERITLSVSKNGTEIGHVTPEKRHYTVRTMNMSEAGVLRDNFSDVYVTLGSKFDSDTFAVRVQIKPYVHLLWIGAFMMLIAGLWGAVYHYKRARLARVGQSEPSPLSERIH